ncbi:hypothetical protein A2U01_0064943, partial [Trifolium medium]|nr:hypothetical protein [Trifolium medium]
VRRAKAQVVEATGGRPKRRRVVRTQPQPKPQGDPEHVVELVHVAEPQPDVVHVAKPQPDPAPAPAAEEDDMEQLGEADFQKDDDAVQEGVTGKKGEKLEGPSWTECIFPPA